MKAGAEDLGRLGGDGAVGITTGELGRGELLVGEGLGVVKGVRDFSFFGWRGEGNWISIGALSGGHLQKGGGMCL